MADPLGGALSLTESPALRANRRRRGSASRACAPEPPPIDPYRMPLPIAAPGHRAAAGGDFVWFLYGSSLDRGSFLAWASEHGYSPPDLARAFPARLEGFRLAFDVASRYWGGAVGSLLPETGRRVEGLALPMDGSALGLADHKEGAVSGLYQAQPVEVVPLAGGPAVAALAWVSSLGRRLAAEAPPSRAWLEAVIRGARAAPLSAEWVSELERLRGV